MKIEYLNIVITDEGIYEYEENKVFVFVPKNEIKKLSFGFSDPTRWPFVALLIGAMLIGAGVTFGVLPLINTIIEGKNTGLNILKGYAYISLNILPGIYFSYLGLRKQNCLILETNKGIRKLIIKGQVDGDKIGNFLIESANKFEYPI